MTKISGLSKQSNDYLTSPLNCAINHPPSEEQTQRLLDRMKSHAPTLDRPINIFVPGSPEDKDGQRYRDNTIVAIAIGLIGAVAGMCYAYRY